MYIAIEGSEGSGKSSVVNFLRERLPHAHFVREPGGTPIAEKVREILLWGDPGETLDSTSELLLMATARNQVLQKVVKPLLSEDNLIISDRCYWSSAALQCVEDSDWYLFEHVHNAVLRNGLSPDYIIYLDVEPEIGLRRAAARSTPDRFEQRDLAYFNGVRKRYMDMVKMQKETSIVINANGTLEETLKAVENAITKLVPISLRGNWNDTARTTDAQSHHQN